MKYKNLIYLLLLFLLETSCREEPYFLPSYKAVFMSVPTKIPTPRVPDAPITGNGDIGVVYAGSPEKQLFYFSKTNFWKFKLGFPKGGACFLGGLEIKSEKLEDASYYAEQVIDSALIKSNFVKGTYHYQLESWTAASENLLIIELSNQGEDLPITMAFQEAVTCESINDRGKTDDVYWTTRKFEGTDIIIPTGVAIAMKIMDEENLSFTLGSSQTRKIAIAFCSNFDDDDYLAKAISMVSSVNNKKLVCLKEDHITWWRNFWNESFIEIGDPFLEKYYYTSQYLLACASRNKAFAPGLWGNSLTMDATSNGWAGDYHTNYNHSAPWWGVYSSNRSYLADPYDTPILEYMEEGKCHARDFLNCQGVYYPVGIGPKGLCTSVYPFTLEEIQREWGVDEMNMEGGYMFCGQKSNALFISSNMFMRYYHTYDKEYAAKVYPYIKEVATFWEDYLTFEDGKYSSLDDGFWEVGPWAGKNWKDGFGDKNPVQTIGMLRMLFNGIIDMSTYLAVDEVKQEKWRQILTHLSPVPTIEIDGETVIKPSEGTGAGSRTNPGFGRVSMHGLVFPAGACGVITDSVFAVNLRTEIEGWTGRTSGDANWYEYFGGFETYFTSAARLGYDGEVLLEKLKERIQGESKRNLWITQNEVGLETLSGVPFCINEMLLQGYEGVVRLFPVWPKSKDAKFNNLCTHGAFVLSSSLKNGEVEYVKIVSRKGRTCCMENPYFPNKMSLKSNKRNSISTAVRYYEFQTQEGEEFIVQKED